MEYLIINITDKSVMAARFAMAGRTTLLQGAAEFVLGDDLDLAAVAAKIAEAVSGAPRVILCLSPLLYAQRTLELPLSDLRKVREILPAQLQGDIALPAEEAVFDVMPSTGGFFLALWAKRSDISTFIELFKQAGCEPQIVTAAPFAWPLLPSLPADCVVTDGSALALVTKGRLGYVRPLESGDFHKHLTATLSALELTSGGLPEKLIVFGDQTEVLPSVKGLLLEVAPLVMPDELVETFRTEKNFQQLAGLYAVACASRAGNLPDFRRGSLAWTAGNEKLRRQLRVTAALAVTLFVLLFASKILQYRGAKSDLASLNNSISAQYREIFPGRSKAVDELAEVKGELRKLTGTENSGITLDVLKKVAEAKGTTINGLYEIELDGRVLRLKGDARSTQGANEFKAALANLLTAPELGEIKSRPDGTVSFSLSGQIKEGGQ
jgi:general secretion pathway protein L